VAGPILSAIMQPRLATDGSLLLIQDLSDGYYALLAQGGEGKIENAFLSKRQGVLLGKVGELRPKLFQLETTDLVYSWRVSSKYLARAEAPALHITMYPLDGAPPFGLASAANDPDYLVPGPQLLRSDWVLFGMGSLSMQGVMAYDPILGTHPLIRWYGDKQQGAYNAGTDGVHLVWTYGEEHPPTQGIYPKRSIMVSPFSTDPKKLDPKRLRSDPNPAFDVNFAVGCGYASHAAYGKEGLLIVRLADGVSWLLPSTEDQWTWGRAIGMTCEHVYTYYSAKQSSGKWIVNNIARVGLSSLGPGMPPD
jgi:hypothetical protein